MRIPHGGGVSFHWRSELSRRFFAFRFAGHHDASPFDLNNLKTIRLPIHIVFDIFSRAMVVGKIADAFAART
jgi:hypothetical protein